MKKRNRKEPKYNRYKTFLNYVLRRLLIQRFETQQRLEAANKAFQSCRSNKVVHWADTWKKEVGSLEAYKDITDFLRELMERHNVKI